MSDAPHPPWSRDVAEALDTLLDGPAGLAAFDFDHTCIAGDLGETAMVTLEADEGGDLLARYDAELARGGKEHAFPWAAAALGGRTHEELADLAERTWEQHRLAWRPPILELWDRLLGAGWQVAVVTASLGALVQARVHRVRPEITVVGMQLDDADGRLGTRAIPPFTLHEGKVVALEAALGRPPDLAMGDGDTDLHLLRSAQCPVVIDRGQPAIARAALTDRWLVQSGWPFQ